MFTKTTEEDSLYNGLEKMSGLEILKAINQEDQKVAICVEKQLPFIEQLSSAITEKLKNGGRLFYLGAGTSGRLGILDASECPPTYGVDHDLVIGLIAGGDSAIRKAIEFAEDDQKLGWKDLKAHSINTKDIVVGIAASGTTPYVIGALKECRANQITTGCITCNANSPIVDCSDFAVQVVVGPEVVTGSTRMKAGTAQKMVLNMLTTSAMIRLGKVQGNKMTHMQLSNNKLVDRAIKMIQDQLNVDAREAEKLLEQHKSVHKAIKYFKTK